MIPELTPNEARVIGCLMESRLPAAAAGGADTRRTEGTKQAAKAAARRERVSLSEREERVARLEAEVAKLKFRESR